MTISNAVINNLTTIFFILKACFFVIKNQAFSKGPVVESYENFVKRL